MKKIFLFLAASFTSLNCLPMSFAPMEFAPYASFTEISFSCDRERIVGDLDTISLDNKLFQVTQTSKQNDTWVIEAEGESQGDLLTLRLAPEKKYEKNGRLLYSSEEGIITTERFFCHLDEI